MVPSLLAILTWPLAGLVLFQKLPLQQAVIWSIVGGYLFLPEKGSIDLPMLPAISKTTMPSIVAVFMVILAAREHRGAKSGGVRLTSDGPILPGWLPKHRLVAILFIGMLAGEVFTVLTNGDRLVYGQQMLQGLSLYDAASRILTTVMLLLPMLLARKCLATPQHHKTLVFAFVIAGLIYSLPTLWEVRMSPQLNVQIYGLKLEAWVQHVRNDGYRPLVFLHHGLWLAIFMAISSIAAVAYIRLAPQSHRVWAIIAAAWLLGTLTLINSLGGLLIALVLVIPVFFLTGRMQMLIAAGFAAVILVYPMMRSAGLVPVDRALSIAEQIDPRRAQSLGVRFRNEDVLLGKVQQRPLFGWGNWGRNQVYGEDGTDISVTDGAWIILIGSNGWVGYLTRFGLFCVPIMLLAFKRRRYPADVATAAIVMMLTANLLDLIPNATLTPVTWLLAGALLGRLEYDGVAADNTAPVSGDGPTGVRRAGAGRPQPAHGEKLTTDKPTYTRQRRIHHRRTKGPRNG